MTQSRRGEGRVWKMWALMGSQAETWGFDCYHTKSEALRVRCIGDKIIRVQVREIVAHKSAQGRGRKP